ncbi:hypothetical protein FOZ62_001950 [Perkinsus olseni]|uniref:Dynein heavy chain 1, axonemal n=1 Tax=Perkinsus olseni TaxID=32597 RepID=A0A7J6S0L2_PEROL|nr:hypothetical protein FOZ62_001950 [Perkinsus olseni]
MVDSIIVQELSKRLLENIDSLLNGAYCSALSNPLNQRGWSDLISKDLLGKFYGFLSTLHVTHGLMDGRTVLPLPPRESIQTTPPSDGPGMQETIAKDRIHALESSLITWTKQVKHVLKQEPEAALKDPTRNPEPMVEVEFWKLKANNLNSVHDQLEAEELRRVLSILKENKSTYVEPFRRLQEEVERARDEANDNVKFLSSLTKYFEKLASDAVDFADLEKLFDPILHTILLVWKHSKYYNTPARLVVLMRQICNSIIAQACRFVNGPQVFAMIANEEANEAVEKLEKTLEICTAFRDKYFFYRDVAEQQGKEGGWRIQTSALFVRLDAFRERCRDILDFTKTIVQFFKLERVEIGGTKGRELTASLQQIFEEFKQAVEVFQAVSYDIMDVGARAFDHDFYKFRSAVKNLDQRLGAVLGSGFDDLDTIPGRLKLFDAFEGLLERAILQDELERRFAALLGQYHEDLIEVQRLYLDNKMKICSATDDAPLFENMPPVAGAIYWARSLRSRVAGPMPKILVYSEMVKEQPDDFAEVERLHSALCKILDEFEQQMFEGWEADCVDSAKEKLKMRLLRRLEKTGTLKVNFDPQLVRLLREVRYFLLFGLEVPEAALEMYQRANTYREWTGRLDVVVQKYNSVLTELLPVEEPLFADRIQKMDTTLSPGLVDLRWNREDRIPDFITLAEGVIGDVSSVVDVVKSNLRKISAILARWCQAPLLERKPKPMSAEDFDSIHKAAVGVKLHMMTEDGKEIHKLIKDSSEALKVSKTAETWKSYVDFVNNIVIEGLVSAVAVSLQYLCEILDPLIIARNEMQPLFDVKIELQDSEIVFEPAFTLASGSQGSLCLRGVIDGWLKDFFAIGTVMQRLDSGSGREGSHRIGRSYAPDVSDGTGDYLNELKEHFQMQCLLALVSELIDNTEMKCLEYRQKFLEHSFLWLDSIQDSFNNFLADGAKDLVENFEEEGVAFNEIMAMIGVDLGEPIPPMEKFDKAVTRFTQMKTSISNLKTPVDIHWLRINIQPVKIHLVQFAGKWEYTYTNYLQEFCEGRIGSLCRFIDKVNDGLTQHSPADDPENEKLLYATMTHIRDVKLAMEATKLLFNPIREQVQTLKKHGVVLPEEQLQELDLAPARWEEVIRAAFDEKEKILPLQSAEMLKIRRKIDAFAGEVAEYRSTFLRECPFAAEHTYEEAYGKLDDFYERTMAMVERAKEYNNLELLFDMAMSGYRELKDSQEDLVLLKNLWDAIALINFTFEDWNSTLWDRINTDDLLMRVKELGTQVKAMPKEIRGWKLYAWLQDIVKNMSTVLPLISDLHSETMRDRHWNQLMDVTGTTFTKGPEFCFKDLLDLELYKFADDVSEIVDQSVKEAKIEKKLSTIRTTWTKLTLEFDHSREDCPLLKELGEVVEILESHSLEMMGMVSQGRFIEFCQAVVDEWSTKLRTVDSVLTVWQKVQRNWCRLEPIFMLSDDIRSQLPEDSKRFEALDAEWKDLMVDASQSSNAVEICCAEGREEVLHRLNEAIEACEKSLNDYLEQKKKAFPRFYFVANQALLDILSNGNRPLKVAEYLGDCFDGVKSLNFEKDPVNGRIGTGIISKDKEYVPFYEDVVLEGAVETYLTNLESHIRCTLRDILDNARATAENWEVDKPREIWLQDYCAQLALVTTQLVWTEETARAFDELEGGSETAMKDYKRVCDDRIEKLIKQVVGEKG